MNNKKLTLFDLDKTKERADIISGNSGAKDWNTEIIFRDLDGNVLLKTKNKVLIAGSQLVAQKVFNLDELVALPTYNTDLQLDNSDNSNPQNPTKVVIFCCGTKGCGLENSQVYPVKYTGRIAPTADIIPFRYQLPQNDLSDELRGKYFGRKTTPTRVSYYFKGFETEPTMKARFVDGTVIDANLYNVNNNQDAELFVEMSLIITKEDFRDYFKDTTGINDAKINSISLCTAWYNENGGFKYYQDIRPFTQLNIPNEPLIDLTKGIDITYHIYF